MKQQANSKTKHQPAERLLTIEQLAESINVGKKRIYDWRYRRLGPPSIKIGNTVRYRQSDVDQWLEAHTETLDAG